MQMLLKICIILGSIGKISCSAETKNKTYDLLSILEGGKEWQFAIYYHRTIAYRTTCETFEFVNKTKDNILMLRIVHNFEEVTTQSKTKIFELWEKTDKNYLRNVTFMDEIICKKFIPIGQHFSPVTGSESEISLLGTDGKNWILFRRQIDSLSDDFDISFLIRQAVDRNERRFVKNFVNDRMSEEYYGGKEIYYVMKCIDRQNKCNNSYHPTNEKTPQMILQKNSSTNALTFKKLTIVLAIMLYLINL